MKAEYINPLLQSTITVLSTMARVEAKAGKPTLKKGAEALGDVTGTIDLSGPVAHGSLAISFSKTSILDIAEKMLGEKFDTVDDAVVDVVGELTNMITGSAKRIYSEQGIDFDLTLPSMIVGRVPIKHSVDGVPLVLPFSTDAGKLYLEFCFT